MMTRTQKEKLARWALNLLAETQELADEIDPKEMSHKSKSLAARSAMELERIQVIARRLTHLV